MTVIPYKFRLQSDSPVLFGLAFAIPTIAALAPLQISTVAIVAALVVIIRRLVARGPWPFIQARISLILAAMVGWATISSTWAIDGTLSLITAGRLLLAASTLVILIDVASRLSAPDQKRFYRCLSAGAVIGISLTLLSIGYVHIDTIWFQGKEMAEHELGALNRTASIIAIFAWPWSLSISRVYGNYVATAFIATVTATLYFLAPLTPLIALLVGSCAFVVAWKATRLAKILLLVVFASCILIVPFLNNLVPWIIEYLSENLSNPINTIHRFVIWQFAAEQILERPLIGWGLDAARVFPGGNLDVFLFHLPTGAAVTGPALPLHTHNAVIQIWLELGLIGIAFFTILFVWTINTIAHIGDRNGNSAVSIAVVATGLTISQLGFGFWQGWWLATLGLAAVTTTATVRQCSWKT